MPLTAPTLHRLLARTKPRDHAKLWRHAALPLLAALLCLSHYLRAVHSPAAASRSKPAAGAWVKLPQPQAADKAWLALREKWPGLAVVEADQKPQAEQLQDYQLIALLPSPQARAYALLQKRAASPAAAAPPLATPAATPASGAPDGLIRRGLGEQIAGYTIVAIGPRSLRVRKGEDEQVIPIFKPQGPP